MRPTDARLLESGNKSRIDKELTAIAYEVDEILGGRPERKLGPGKPVHVPPEKVAIAKLPTTGEHLFGREKELARLGAAWEDDGTNVISLVAFGGVGKSALVNHWLAGMAKEDFRGARRVYGWSFYSQGTRQTAVSADDFIDAT